MMVHRSPKNLGDYEEPLMIKISEHFQELGFQTHPHSSLNFAWHGIVSDVDVLMVKDSLLYGVEIKSKKDDVKRAKKQIERLFHYVDYCYLAVEKMPKRLVENAGLIIVDDWGVKIIKDAPLVDGFDKRTFRTLKRICFTKIFNTTRYGSKHDVVDYIWAIYSSDNLKSIFRKILLCSEKECSICPLRSMYDSTIVQTSLLKSPKENPE